MEKWHTNFRLIHKKGMFKPHNLKINNGIFKKKKKKMNENEKKDK